MTSAAVLSIGPGTCRSSGGYSVESRRVYLTFKNSPERNSCGLLILLRRVLFQGSHLLQILLKALTVLCLLFAVSLCEPLGSHSSGDLLSSSNLHYIQDTGTQVLHLELKILERKSRKGNNARCINCSTHPHLWNYRLSTIPNFLWIIDYR